MSEMIKCELYDEDILIETIELPIAPDEFEPDINGVYMINSDEPRMPTEAMMAFMKLGKLKVPLPPSKNHGRSETRKLLDDYREYVLAEVALDDFKDMMTLVQQGSPPDRLWNHVVDILHSRIFRNKGFASELNRLLEKYKADALKREEVKGE